MQQNAFTWESDSTALGLYLTAASLAAAVLLLVLCTCFKRKDGESVADEDKNGHIFALGRKELGDGDGTEAAIEGLGGARATSHRRLPDLPDPLAGTGGSVRSSQDTTSELYAQVAIGAVLNSFQTSTVPADVEIAVDYNVASAVAFSTESEETFLQSHPYDKVKANHGYSKIKKKGENPYATVKRSDTMESETAEPDENETDTDNYDVVYNVHNDDVIKNTSSPSMGERERSMESSNLLPPPLPLPQRGSHSSVCLATSSAESSTPVPLPPPRGRRSVVMSHASSSGSIHRPSSAILNLHAADLAALGADDADNRNADEALRMADLGAVGAAPQIHFSGDSQASQDSKGYSSISVREPLANLKTQNPRVRLRGNSHQRGSTVSTGGESVTLDPHYSTVSDDSDEMYAAIAEPLAIYTANSATGSDTYAKINDGLSASALASNGIDGVPNSSSGLLRPISSLATSSSTVGLDRATAESMERLNSSPIPPTPPSVVSLRQLSAGSNRLHASTLSIASQTSGVGSPKPEKRQANSPLPPPPIVGGQAEVSMVDGALDRQSNRKSVNLEEMYAKVMKKKGFSVAPASYSVQHRGSLDLGLLGTSRERDSEDLFNSYPRGDNSRRNSVDSTPHSQRLNDFNELSPEHAVGTVADGASGVVASVAEEEDDDEDLRYEVLPALRRGTLPQRKISESDPGYEKIQLKSADSFNDPRYERIHLKPSLLESSEAEVEPNYEIVRYQGSPRISESNEPGYEEVELAAKGFSRGDPNYESLHYTDDLHYTLHTDSLTEPPYDKVDKDEDLGDEGSEPGQSSGQMEDELAAVPLYAQVVKTKRPAALSPSTDGAEEMVSPVEVTIVQEEQDYSVSSSKNTTIIRISTDNRPTFCYFSDDDALGIPEQV